MTAVTATAAGRSLPCACGRDLIVPSLSELKRSAGLPAYPAGGGSIPLLSDTGLVCEACGVEAPTRWVMFHQNIGAIIVRFPHTVSGRLCRRCVTRSFLACTGITLVGGWWGIVSFFLTPLIIVHNIGRYGATLGMAGVPVGAVCPALTELAAERLRPYGDELSKRIAGGEDVASLARDVSQAAGVTPAQIVLFLTGKV